MSPSLALSKSCSVSRLRPRGRVGSERESHPPSVSQSACSSDSDGRGGDRGTLALRRRGWSPSLEIPAGPLGRRAGATPTASDGTDRCPTTSVPLSWRRCCRVGGIGCGAAPKEKGPTVLCCTERERSEVSWRNELPKHAAPKADAVGGSEEIWFYTLDRSIDGAEVAWGCARDGARSVSDPVVNPRKRRDEDTALTGRSRRKS